MAQEKRKGLGRGLSALIPTGEPKPGGAASGAPPGGALVAALSEISANPGQPRRNFDPAAIEALSASIREQGVLQPILVRKKASGGYEVIAGERRLRAARQAGLAEVPVVVRPASDKESLELALVENLQREDLNPIELAQGYESLIADYGYTQEQLAKRLGRERSGVANTLRLLKLPEDVREDLIAGRLTAGHAKALLALEDPAELRKLRDLIVGEGVSVRAAEELSRLWSVGEGGRGARKKKGRRLDPDVADLIQRLERKLGTKVEISHSPSGKGKITIRYASLEALQPILDKLES